MTDKATCSVSYTKWFWEPGNNPDLEYVIVSIVDGGSVGITSKDLYPHEKVYLRVDQNEHYISSHYDDDTAFLFEDERLTRETKNGQILRLRYTKWPEKYNEQLAIPLEGFKQEYDRVFEAEKEKRKIASTL
jgi:hypothetical protein